ncbi:hypothetical protein M2323_000235 [Rhodoblastus acidophilus]|uniref:hypothetical protein n=1 Tax=Rhodoblastus acidophilus TaxID=1074 RepID=UPI002225874B|nr:hypothetical protein [Rhodoblastus acidophilus]MCW2282258.1 hypothetical protein [Rhodoblastus acidophilus]MCW2331337.1 hypothetical protein [Rhodoblastus acidophilus]
MASNKITHTSDYDYANVIKRLRQAQERQEHEIAKKAPVARMTRLYVRRAPVAAPPPPKVSPWSKIGRVFGDEKRQLLVAGVVMAGFASWMVSMLQGYLDRNEQSQLAAACHENQFAHAGSTICFDDRHFVHMLNADGTTSKGAIDWKVNEASHRVAEAAAAREARARAGQ